MGIVFLKKVTSLFYRDASDHIDELTKLQHYTLLAYTPCLKKLCKIGFQNFIKFPPILIIFDRMMAKRLQLCKVHSFFTSPNSPHHTTVLNADVSPRIILASLPSFCQKISKLVEISRCSDKINFAQFFLRHGVYCTFKFENRFIRNTESSPGQLGVSFPLCTPTGGR